MAIIRQSLTETANTFSQNQTLNGTANTAPNQTAASASSLMSRTLVDDEPFFNIGRCFSPLPVPSTGTAGGGTVSVNTNGYYVNVGIPENAAASSYARASLYRQPTAIYPNFVTPPNGIDFSKRLGFMLKIGYRSYNGTFSSSPTTLNNTYLRVYMGGNGGVPAVANANALTNRGFGIEVTDIDFCADGCLKDQFRIFCHNGTTYSTSAWFDFPTSPAGSFGGTIGVVSNGAGTITAFYGSDINRPTIVGSSLTGGPTTSGPNTLNWLDAVVVNSNAPVFSSEINVIIQNAMIIAG
jgi:hypothetical protein